MPAPVASPLAPGKAPSRLHRLIAFALTGAGLLGATAAALGQTLTVEGANSPYTLSSGSLATSQTIVGDTGTGVFNHSGGTHTTQFLTLADQGSSSGTYNLSGSGVLNVQNAEIGFGGTGLFTQSGGSFTAVQSLVFGEAGGHATYNLDGGTLSVPSIIDYGQMSIFNFNGGTLRAKASDAGFIYNFSRLNVRTGGAIFDTNGLNVTLGSSLVHSNLGGDAATDGGLTKNGAGTLTLSAVNSYTGQTVVNAGTLAITGSITGGTSVNDGGIGMTVSGPAASAAAATLSGSGSLSLNSAIKIGVGGSGSFTQSGGAVVSTYASQAALVLGDSSQSSGVYTLTGGSLTLGSAASANTAYIGLDGAGTFVQSGGTAVIKGADDGEISLTIGVLPTGNGIYTLSGTGSLSVPLLCTGFFGKGLFDQTGGTVTASELVVGSKGTYRLAGGNLTTKLVKSSSDAGSIFNFEGGLLTAAASATNFFQGVTTANVRTAGARIDTNGFDVTVAQALVHSTISGDAALDGGLAKSGLGALTLTGANTYTGGTSVIGGELIAGAGSSLGTGGVSVLGTALRLTLAIGVTDAIADIARLTLAGGGAPGVADAGYLLLNGNTETVGSLVLGGIMYTSGTFTSAAYPEYLSGAGSLVVVPEPAIWQAGLAGTLLLLSRRPHRKARS